MADTIHDARHTGSTAARLRTIARGILPAAALALAAWTAACGGGSPGADTADQAGNAATAEQPAADSAQRPQRPGMLRAVDRARATSDSMAARAARMDSIH